MATEAAATAATSAAFSPHVFFNFLHNLAKVIGFELKPFLPKNVQIVSIEAKTAFEKSVLVL